VEIDYPSGKYIVVHSKLNGGGYVDDGKMNQILAKLDEALKALEAGG